MRPEMMDQVQQQQQQQLRRAAQQQQQSDDDARLRRVARVAADAVQIALEGTPVDKFIFHKLARRAHKRFLQLSPDRTAVHWSSKPGGRSRGSVAVATIEKILPGAQTVAFKSSPGFVESQDMHDSCFSIVTTGRTLDVRMPDKQTRDQWVLGLLSLRFGLGFLLELKGAQGAHSSGGLVRIPNDVAERAQKRRSLYPSARRQALQEGQAMAMEANLAHIAAPSPVRPDRRHPHASEVREARHRRMHSEDNDAADLDAGDNTESTLSSVADDAAWTEETEVDEVLRALARQFRWPSGFLTSMRTTMQDAFLYTIRDLRQRWSELTAVGVPVSIKLLVRDALRDHGLELLPVAAGAHSAPASLAVASGPAASAALLQAPAIGGRPRSVSNCSSASNLSTATSATASVADSTRACASAPTSPTLAAAAAPPTTPKGPATQKERERMRQLLKSIPEHWICPLSREIFRDPVATLDGHCYEREYIENWFLRGHNTDPLTGITLELTYLVPVHALRQSIAAWREQVGLDEDQ